MNILLMLSRVPQPAWSRHSLFPVPRIDSHTARSHRAAHAEMREPCGARSIALADQCHIAESSAWRSSRDDAIYRAELFGICGDLSTGELAA
jgi:hypothetical protein